MQQINNYLYQSQPSVPEFGNMQERTLTNQCIHCHIQMNQCTCDMIKIPLTLPSELELSMVHFKIAPVASIFEHQGCRLLVYAFLWPGKSSGFGMETLGGIGLYCSSSGKGLFSSIMFVSMSITGTGHVLGLALLTQMHWLDVTFWLFLSLR